MSNILYLDALQSQRYRKNSPAGTDLDPDIPEYIDSNSAAILAKLTEIEVNQSTDPATETTLATLATEATAATLATEATLAAASAKLTSDPATETTLASIETQVLEPDWDTTTYINPSASGDSANIVAAPGVGFRIRYQVFVVPDVEGTETSVEIKSGSTVQGVLPFHASLVGYNLPLTFVGLENQPVLVNLADAVSVHVTVSSKVETV